MSEITKTEIQNFIVALDKTNKYEAEKEFPLFVHPKSELGVLRNSIDEEIQEYIDDLPTDSADANICIDSDLGLRIEYIPHIEYMKIPPQNLISKIDERFTHNLYSKNYESYIIL